MASSIITQSFTITGLSPMLMHCGQTADPLNQFSKAMKALSGKRGKTDDDLELIGNVEWWAGLYLDTPATINKDTFAVSVPKTAKLTIPAHVLDSAIREGARKGKMGKQASAGVIVEGDGQFIHEGPSDLNKMAADPAFRARHAVKVGTAKVMRCRPRFDAWSVTFAVCIDPTVIDVADVRRALESAGRLVGMGDWRPGAPRGGSFGRFEVK